MKKLLFISILFFCVTLVNAQGLIKGVVKDARTSETLISASIMYGENKGVVTDINGKFSMSVPNGEYKLTVSYVGYKSVIRNVSVSNNTQNLVINLQPEILDEVTLVADIAQERKTPVAFTSITPKKITEELGGRDLPLVLNQTPGVYATQSGGGDGDARINIRGFKQENMAVLIDGIPVNDMENGAVYWSNWFGLDIVTKRMQVQRGLSASKLSIPSVGGTINILTNDTESKKYLKVRQAFNQWGKSTTNIGYNSGMSEKGWNFTGAFSYKKGENYTDNSGVEGFFAYAKGTKKWDNHILSLSGFIAPQEHAQRSSQQRILAYDSEYAHEQGIDTSKYLSVQPVNLGRAYNRDWGYIKRSRYNNFVDKEALTVRKNFYMKPQLNLNHTYLVNDDLVINNALYLSIGKGGGTNINSTVGAKYYDENGLIDLQPFYDQNARNPIEKTGNLHKSNTFLIANHNEHVWGGLLSKVDYQMNDAWNLSGGLDLRTYEGKHFKTVHDLLGGDYVSDPNQKDVLVKEGDTLDFNNSVFVNWAGLFGQAEYTEGALSGFLNLSVSNISFRKEDYYSNEESETKNKIGFTVKTGANYNLDENSNIFVNVGYLNKARPSKFIFNGYTTDFRAHTDNEVVTAAELGYHFGSSKFTIDANAYYTLWNGKPVNNIKVPGEDNIFFVLPGLDARHMGVEIDGVYKITPKVDLQGTVSIGDWVWTSKNVGIEVYNQQTGVTESSDQTFSFDGVHVGDAPQTQLGASLNVKPIKGAYVRLKYGYNARYFSDYNPEPTADNLGDNYKPIEPWRIPDYGRFDLFLGYNFKIKKHKVAWQFSLFNVLDTKYISDARNNARYMIDGQINNNDAASASVFFGAGRNLSTSIKITL
ncbi:MAG: TonB-dependent receptor [Flavobacteriales bacterium]|jgi:hypothetical protein|nr:TonB-dependent receptor [Flavobacteriales bacterium]